MCGKRTYAHTHAYTCTLARTSFLGWMSAGWASLQALRRKSEKSSSNRRRQAFIERAAHWKSAGVPYPSLLRAAPNLMQSAFYRASPGRSAATECVCVCVKARVKSIQDLWRRCLSSRWEDRAREIMFIRTTVKKKKKKDQIIEKNLWSCAWIIQTAPFRQETAVVQGL